MRTSMRVRERGVSAGDYGSFMSIDRINPSELVEPAGYAHVVVATGTRRVYVAGQTGVGVDGVVVGDDLASQTAQALRNVGTALAAGGASSDDVVKLHLLIVGDAPAMAQLFENLRMAMNRTRGRHQVEWTV